MQTLIVIGAALIVAGTVFVLRKGIYSAEELSQEIKREEDQSGRRLA